MKQSYIVIFIVLLQKNDAVENKDGASFVRDQLLRAEDFNLRLQEELQLQVTEHKELYNQYRELFETSHRQRRQACNTNSPIVFHSRLKNSINPIGDNQIIAYDIVETNTGNAYDKFTGIFQAPFNGVYQFLATMWSYGSYYLEFQIEHNGNDLCYGRATASNQSMGVCFAIVQLATGDRVWVRHKNGAGSYANGDEYPVFTGHQIIV